MEKKHDQPYRESQRASWQGDEHKPTHHPERIKQMPVIPASDQARMHRVFVNLAAMRISNHTARHDGSHRRERDDGDECEDDPIANPWETFPNR